MTLGITIMVILMIALHRVFAKRMLHEQERFFQQQLLHERNLIIQTVKTQEHEREYIAGELHDSVGNKLNLLSLWINHSANFPPEKYQELISRELKDVINATRNISHKLFPTGIETTGFITALDELLFKFSSHFTMDLKWPQHQLFFGFEKEIQLYRVVQELLNNIVKHSEATVIYLSLRDTGKSIQLIVGDNGKGFDPAAHNKGVGMQNITYRLTTIKAHSKWKSSPGNGARIIINFQYDGEQQNKSGTPG